MSREDTQFFRINHLIPREIGSKYVLGEALLMATYADLLLRQCHLKISQIGFVTQPDKGHNYQTNVLRYLLQKRLLEFNSSTNIETLKQIVIGSEYEFTLQNWTRDAILRGRSNWSTEEERAMCLRWYAITITTIHTSKK